MTRGQNENCWVVTAQSVSTAEDTAKAITLAASDMEHSPLTYVIVIQSAHGTLSGTAPNVTYTPSANYNGPDSFTFKANDGIFDSAPATVTITVTAVTVGSYSIWASANSVTGGENGDSDNDGLTNLAEYTLGTDPHSSDPSLLTLAPVVGNSFTLN